MLPRFILHTFPSWTPSLYLNRQLVFATSSAERRIPRFLPLRLLRHCCIRTKWWFSVTSCFPRYPVNDHGRCLLSPLMISHKYTRWHINLSKRNILPPATIPRPPIFKFLGLPSPVQNGVLGKSRNSLCPELAVAFIGLLKPPRSPAGQFDVIECRPLVSL